MGMGLSMDALRRNVRVLEKTWQAWFDDACPARRADLRDNFEYLLKEVQTFLGYVEEEWRTAFPKPEKTPKFDETLHHDIVSGYVPSWEKKV